LRQAVFGNVGTLISFRVGYRDAEALHHEFGEGFISQQFVDLGKYEAFIRLHQDGQAAQAFRAVSAAPIPPRPRTGTATIIARSRERFTSSRRGVEKKLQRWLENSSFG
jgi:hypothetical protein